MNDHKSNRESHAPKIIKGKVLKNFTLGKKIYRKGDDFLGASVGKMKERGLIS